MVLEQEFANAIQELVKHEYAKIHIGESLIHIHVIETTKKLSLSTSVYQGENYLPSSVRKASLHHFSDSRRIHTFLKTDEETFTISLRYLGDLEAISKKEFRILLEEFAAIADEWRTFFDDHDKRDRIHVTQRRL